MGHKYDDDCKCQKCTDEFNRVLFAAIDRNDREEKEKKKTKKKKGKKDGKNDEGKTASTEQKGKNPLGRRGVHGNCD